MSGTDIVGRSGLFLCCIRKSHAAECDFHWGLYLVYSLNHCFTRLRAQHRYVPIQGLSGPEPAWQGVAGSRPRKFPLAPQHYIAITGHNLGKDMQSSLSLPHNLHCGLLFKNKPALCISVDYYPLQKTGCILLGSTPSCIVDTASLFSAHMEIVDFWQHPF